MSKRWCECVQPAPLTDSWGSVLAKQRACSSQAGSSWELRRPQGSAHLNPRSSLLLISCCWPIQKFKLSALNQHSAHSRWVVPASAITPCAISGTASVALWTEGVGWKNTLSFFLFLFYFHSMSQSTRQCVCISVVHLWTISTDAADKRNWTALPGSPLPAGLQAHRWKNNLGCLSLPHFLLISSPAVDNLRKKRSSVSFHHNCILQNLWDILTYSIIFLASRCYFILRGYLFIYLCWTCIFVIMPGPVLYFIWNVLHRFMDWEWSNFLAVTHFW